MQRSQALWLIPLSCAFLSFAPRAEPTPAVAARVDAAMSTRDDDKDKDVAARRILAATNSGEMGKQVVKQLFDYLGKQPGMSKEFLEKFLSQVDPGELVELVVPIYKEHYDVATLNAVADFYESPGGKKFVAAQAAVVQEATAKGRDWGIGIAKRVTEAMKKESAEKK